LINRQIYGGVFSNSQKFNLDIKSETPLISKISQPNIPKCISRIDRALMRIVQTEALDQMISNLLEAQINESNEVMK
tara:strand:- start:610 stop:840 length:231 start_codon:yes stop_codon:yes gene_type:complete